MTFIWGLLDLLLFLFLVFLIGRLVFDWVQVFARDWRPRGILLVVAEAIYSVTDPPLRALRRVIPPLSIGQVRIDLAFFVLFLLVSLARTFISAVRY